MTYNAPYTVVAWTLNPQVGQTETVAEFTVARNDLATIEFRQGRDRNNGLVAHNASFENSGAPRECVEGEGKWQHWVITFDGYNERIYLDGKMIQEKNMFLMIRPQGHITLGSSMDGGNKFSGYIHSLQFYDKSFTDEEVMAAYKEKSDTEDKITVSSEFSVSARPLSPSLVSLSVTETNGAPVETGLLTFSYGISSDTKSDNCIYGSPTNCSSVILSTDGKKRQKCFVKITDDSGEFSQVRTVVLNLSDDTFRHFVDEASKPADYLKDWKAMGWDGVLYGGNVGNDLSAKSDGGAIVLSSSNTNFTADKSQNGVLLYKEIEGDFLMQGLVADIDGSEKHSTPAYNEGGIMVLDDSGEQGQNIVHLGVFPNYNCGNMLTVLTRHSRPQYPNGSGWNYDKYLQIERVGDMFYARTSKDGKEWKEMPGSPVKCERMNGKKLKVGLYQTTYSANHSWVSFDDFNLWQKK
ncbi:MAG: LamG domain-containing protein [Bacteroides sp.]|nr:LamG domain-containing protein [Bacteroides sp.]MCM1421680.1 LamG domain-containing protein [Bacteroides sp.]